MNDWNLPLFSSTGFSMRPVQEGDPTPEEVAEPEGSDGAGVGSDAARVGSEPKGVEPGSARVESEPRSEGGGVRAVARGPGSPDETIAKKVYYSIGEVCALSGLKPHVLRYWESQFDVLNPSKNRAGNRVYQAKEIEIILLVKKLLYDEKYTIDGANRRLLELRREGELKEERQEAVGPEFVTSIKTELQELRRILTPKSHGRAL